MGLLISLLDVCYMPMTQHYCHHLSKLVNICEHFGNQRDIKFTATKSQRMTLGSNNPSSASISTNGL